jgi:uncharacterized protein (DUF427 family)
VTQAASGHPGYSVYYDYRVDVLRRRNTVTASLGGVELARSDRALLVDEQNHGLVFYFPREAVRFDRLEAMPERSSVCPWKGVASYWRAADGTDPIAWSYEDPLPQVGQIKDYIGFYQDRVTVALGTAPYLPPWSPGSDGAATQPPQTQTQQPARS